MFDFKKTFIKERPYLNFEINWALFFQEHSKIVDDTIKEGPKEASFAELLEMISEKRKELLHKKEPL